VNDSLTFSIRVVFKKRSSYNKTITLQFGGEYLGTKKLRIGEIADITGVTKRTIDYYTNLGLLKAERSSSNYRYYDESVIEQLQHIEECKANGMSLEEVKKKMIAAAEEVDILELRLKIKGLEKEVSEILAHIDKNDAKKCEYLKNNISKESLSLIQTLLLLIH